MDGIFEGSARDKFYDILFHANRAVVSNELDKIFEIFVAMREICDENGFDEAYLQNFMAREADKIYNGLNDVYIGLSGEILSQNE
ncbi:DUF2018 family protein [Campylobacter curvus]|uniref:DUF2018 family protein n=1 Tax=Campylobacter curvus TaxID=200 RepID=UPI00036EF675|nr:DUF2018 family protein [Campylobacter curvus]QKF61382.1 DUF2018 domain-containing protein [Campylobacter curvus]UEB49695.1 DUF2018 family protein [Campylobacter curvus]